jgi:hypothetical protein
MIHPSRDSDILRLASATSATPLLKFLGCFLIFIGVPKNHRSRAVHADICFACHIDYTVVSQWGAASAHPSASTTLGQRPYPIGR